MVEARFLHRDLGIHLRCAMALMPLKRTMERRRRRRELLLTSAALATDPDRSLWRIVVVSSSVCMSSRRMHHPLLLTVLQVVGVLILVVRLTASFRGKKARGICEKPKEIKTSKSFLFLNLEAGLLRLARPVHILMDQFNGRQFGRYLQIITMADCSRTSTGVHRLDNTHEWKRKRPRSQ